jgi:hypothetical protein
MLFDWKSIKKAEKAVKKKKEIFLFSNRRGLIKKSPLSTLIENRLQKNSRRRLTLPSCPSGTAQAAPSAEKGLTCSELKNQLKKILTNILRVI